MGVASMRPSACTCEAGGNSISELCAGHVSSHQIGSAACEGGRHKAISTANSKTNRALSAEHVSSQRAGGAACGEDRHEAVTLHLDSVTAKRIWLSQHIRPASEQHQAEWLMQSLGNVHLTCGHKGASNAGPTSSGSSTSSSTQPELRRQWQDRWTSTVVNSSRSGTLRGSKTLESHPKRQSNSICSRTGWCCYPPG